MLKNKRLKLIALLSLITLLSVTLLQNAGSALISQNMVSWYWTSDTNTASIATGDVNGDGQEEIVTGGYYNDGILWIAQLQVWNPSTLLPLKTVAWNWGGNTQVAAVAVGDVDGDGQVEIVTGGTFYDGTRYNSQLIVFNGSTLAVENVISWYWTNNTYISSVALGNMTGGATLNIVTGGAFYDGTRYNSQLIVWSVTPNLAVQSVTSWFWTGNTDIASVAIGNLTGSATLSIVTGGSFNDGVRSNSQLIVWSNTLAVQGVMSWYQVSNTKISSVAVGNFTGGASLDIISGGTFDDGIRNNAQLIDFNSANLSVKSATSWFITSHTVTNAVTIGNFAGSGNRVVAGGSFYDGSRSNGQLSIWT